ncbi:MAG: hypothetical protein EXS32_03275 [Opitutus sp.]|nr:hypothetical protein [Opitutus sp.]
MRNVVALFFLAMVSLRAAELAAERATVIVLAGAAGEAEFAPVFTKAVETWAAISAQAGARHLAFGGGEPGAVSDHDRLREALAAEPKEGVGELWVVLVGHGTFDGKEAKFNLRGPDLPASELALWLKPFHRPVAVIDTASASAPFLAKLSAPNRVVISSTRSGFEQNYARFGKYLAEAMADPKSDLDKDGQVSLLEAFLGAGQRTNEFYKTEGRLATEHALLDDNGDGLGTPAEWFRGVRAKKQAKDGATLDGTRAHQFHLLRSVTEQQLPPTVRMRRDELEIAVAKLRLAKPKMAEEEYFRELEKKLLELATVYEVK